MSMGVISDFAFYPKIEAQRSGEEGIFVADRDSFLPDKCEPRLRQFVAEAFFVDALQQAGTHFPMNLDRAAYDLLRKLILFAHWKWK